MTDSWMHWQMKDAEGISTLFREVYGDRYVYSELYVPTMIEWNNALHHWRSVVAVKNNCIIGHAALWLHDKDSCAELAMLLLILKPGIVL